MAYSPKKILFSGTTGVLAAVMLFTVISSSPIILEYINPQNLATTGILLVKLTDAPVDLEELWVNITKLEAQSKEDGWIELEFAEDKDWVWVDILTLQNVTMNLSITEIPLGNYTKLRMHVNAASANFTGPEEELTPLEVPPGKIDLIIRFEIKASKTTELLIDMQAEWVAINKNNKLRPVLKATVYNQP
jgi:hypothetical protein